ncbi:hypothetical protein ACHAXT_009030 [Thalassiosira profunda]
MQAPHRDGRRQEGGLAARWQPPARAARPSYSRPAESRATNFVARSDGAGGACGACAGAAAGGGGGRQPRAGHGKENNRERRPQYSKGDPRNRGDRGGPRQPRPRPAKKVVAPDEPSAAGAPANDDAALPRLDPANPVHAKRLRQRRRQILFGKNTAGYEEYTKKVPRHRRRLRSPDCPATPDHTLDVPAKRWQGLVNAWRRGLHKYDPPDLHLRQPAQDKITLAPRPCATEEDRQQEEIAMAKAAGLQVAFGGMSVGRNFFGTEVGEEEIVAAPSAEGELGEGKTEEEAQFAEEAAYRRANEEAGMGDFLGEGCDEDSDDDIL